MNVTQSREKGQFPLAIQFLVEGIVGAVHTYSWNFGDGRSSTEPSPIHVYQMPGIYSGYLDLIDQYGSSFRTLFTVRVYDWDLDESEGGIHVTYTNKCFRAAILSRQGAGIVEWGGDNWVWPEAYVGTCKGVNKSGDSISLVLNRRNGRFYRVGIPDLWQDRVDNYGGHEIPCRLRIKEHLAVAGEQNMLEHRETHITIRPYTEDNRSLDGYTKDGLRTAQEITLNIFKDGEQNTPYTKVQNAPIYGDYMYGRRAKGKRLQAELELSASAFRITKVHQLHENCDERVGPIYAVSSESTWQREFGTPDFWMVRNRTNPLRNRATGLALTGSYTSLITGPDSVVESGIDFGAADSVSVVLPMISAATMSFWLSLMGTPGTVILFPQFSVQMVMVGADYCLRVAGPFGSVDQVLSWDGTSWAFLAVSVDLTYLRIYENGAMKTVVPNPGITSFGGATSMMNGMVVSAFDIRRTPRVISESALGYYYDNVLSEGGNILPMQR